MSAHPVEKIQRHQRKEVTQSLPAGEGLRCVVGVWSVPPRRLSLATIPRWIVFAWVLATETGQRVPTEAYSRAKMTDRRIRFPRWSVDPCALSPVAQASP